MLYSSTFHCATFPATLYIVDDCLFKYLRKIAYYFVCPSKDIEIKRFADNASYYIILIGNIL